MRFCSTGVWRRCSFGCGRGSTILPCGGWRVRHEQEERDHGGGWESNMSWLEPDDGRWDEPDEGDWSAPDGHRWPLDWRGLYPRERWMWFERLWSDVCALRDRYRL